MARLSFEILFRGGVASGGCGDTISPDCVCVDGVGAGSIFVGVVDGAIGWEGGITCGVGNICGDGSEFCVGRIGSDGGGCAIEPTDGVPGRWKDRKRK